MNGYKLGEFKVAKEVRIDTLKWSCRIFVPCENVKSHDEILTAYLHFFTVKWAGANFSVTVIV